MDRGKLLALYWEDRLSNKQSPLLFLLKILLVFVMLSCVLAVSFGNPAGTMRFSCLVYLPLGHVLLGKVLQLHEITTFIILTSTVSADGILYQRRKRQEIHCN